MTESETLSHLREAGPQFSRNAFLRHINPPVFDEVAILRQPYPKAVS